MQVNQPQGGAEKANTPAEQVLRPANGKARRYLVERDNLHQLGGIDDGADCVAVVPLDDYNHLLNELFAEQRGRRALVGTLRRSFQLLDDNGLDEAEHHCEWHIQQERKRLHAIIDAQTPAQVAPNREPVPITCEQIQEQVTGGGCPTAQVDEPQVGKHDPLYRAAVESVIQNQRGSVSFLERRLGIGYNRAARMIEAMERDRIVSGMNRDGARSVLVLEVPRA
jgi:DNA segregation ATPase FtsK/SpoIIIE-like protein